jgi:hypothetical protein
MKLVLVIAAVVLYCVAAVFVFTSSAAVAPLGLIAVGLACEAGSRVIA